MLHKTKPTQPSYRSKYLNFERLEAQLKACHCRIMFSKAKVCLANACTHTDLTDPAKLQSSELI